MKPLNQRIERGLSRNDKRLGGCLVVLASLVIVIWGSLALRAVHNRPAEKPVVKATVKPAAEPKKKLVLYQARREMTVARTEAALQQSVLTHPANFIRVPKGTVVGMTWVGGGSRAWYELTAISNGRPVKLYVYRDSMDGWGLAGD